MRKSKKQQQQLPIPPNPTECWSKDKRVLYFYDRVNAVELFQKDENGQVQHLTLKPTDFVNFTCRLASAGFILGLVNEKTT
jgi:hypothetical protein